VIDGFTCNTAGGIVAGAERDRMVLVKKNLGCVWSLSF